MHITLALLVQYFIFLVKTVTLSLFRFKVGTYSIGLNSHLNISLVSNGLKLFIISLSNTYIKYLVLLILMNLSSFDIFIFIEKSIFVNYSKIWNSCKIP